MNPLTPKARLRKLSKRIDGVQLNVKLNRKEYLDEIMSARNESMDNILNLWDALQTREDDVSEKIIKINNKVQRLNCCVLGLLLVSAGLLILVMKWI